MTHLPGKLDEQMQRLRRRLWVLETLTAALGSLFGLLLSYLLLLASDRFWETPRLLRAALALGGMAAAAAGAWWWVRRMPRRRDPRSLARLVQRAFPRLGDRLLGVMELADATRRPPNVSEGLVQAAMRQVAGEADALDFNRAAGTRPVRRWAPAFAVALALTALAAVAMPQAGWNALLRWVRPASALPRYTFARLEPLPRGTVVPYGEPFAVDARLDPQSEWKPGTARARIGKQRTVTARRDADAYVFSVPGQTRTGTLSVAAGDARAGMLVQPVYRPELLDLKAGVNMPEYLAMPVSVADARKGSLEVVEGSTVTFTGRVSRALGAMVVEAGGQVDVTVRDSGFSAGPIDAAAATNVTFEWRDTAGLSGGQPFAVRLAARKDQPPTAEFHGLQRVVAMLENESLDFEVQGEDDFGVSEVGAVWEHTGPDSAEPKKGVHRATSRGPHERSLRAGMFFAPRALGLGPGRAQLFAAAVDFLPGRQPTRSAPYTVFILDLAEHAKLIARELERMQSALEDIARTEETQLDASLRLKALQPPELQAEPRTEELRQGVRNEEENREAIRKLTDDFRKLSREALRNSTIPERQLREWVQMLEKLRQIHDEEMRLAAEALDAAAQAAPPQEGKPSEREQNVASAAEQQQQAVNKMREMLDEMAKAGEKLTADNFVNRLRACARSERDVGRALAVSLEKTMGVRPEDLPEDLRAAARANESLQRGTQQRVGTIASDLEGYLKRVNRPEALAVQDEMARTNVVERLGAVADLIRDNRAGTAMQYTAHWEKQLLAWADRLVIKRDGGGGEGGGGGQKKLSPELVEAVIRLMRVRKQEEDLRQQTRVLDERKADTPAYAATARELSGVQDELRLKVEKLPDEVKLAEEDLAELRPLLNAVNGAMADARDELAKPETGVPAVAAETEVIEMLSPPENQNQGGKSGGKRSQAMDPAAMARMLETLRRLQQTLGMQAGPAGGGSTAGGEATGAAAAVGGEAGTGRGRRDVEKAAGRDTAAWPVEFRDALEAYFKAVEEK